MDISPVMWNAVKDGGFAALCVFLIWWVFKSTGEREKSFRERETAFIDCMQNYGEQLKHIADLLNQQTERIEHLSRQLDASNEVGRRAIDRRLKGEP